MADAPATPPFRLPEDAGERDLLAKLFRGLGDPIRLAIIDLLDEHGELAVSALVERLGEPQPKVSNHLAALRWCGFVETRRSARLILYRIADRRVLEMVADARALLALRGEDEAAAEVSAPATDAQALVFRLGDGEYAVPLRVVREVLRDVATRRMPGLPPDAEGVASHRGAVVTVRDTALRLGLPAVAAGGAVIVVDGEKGPIGWRVDAVVGLLSLGEATLGAPPVGSDDIDVVAAVGDRLVLVLRPATLGVVAG